MTEDLDSVLRSRLDRLTRAVPVAPTTLRPFVAVTPRYRGGSGLGVLAGVVLVLVLALAAASMGGRPAPTETPSPSPSGQEPSPALIVQLLTATRAPASGACRQALMVGTLRGDATNQSRPVWVETRAGVERTILWPYGFSARFSPSLELLNEQGDVVARQGDLLDLTGGVGVSRDLPYDFNACRVHLASGSTPDWGPLAVIPPPDGTDLARNEGTLRITDACVYLEDPGGDLWLLVWPADRTTWSQESRSITFENFDGSVVTVVDGDRVVLGGGGSSEAESGISGEEWVRRIDWVAPPSSSCSLDPRFFVGGVGDD